MKRTFGIILMITFLMLALVASISMIKPSSAQSVAVGGGAYYEAYPPEITLNQSASNQQFNVTLELNNLTIDNAPSGISGIEVHLTWDNNTFQAVSFISDVGVLGVGPLGSGVLFGINPGLYVDSGGTTPSAAPYTDATHYDVAGAVSTAWNASTDSIIAVITFQTIATPATGTPSVIGFDFTDLKDPTNGTPNYYVVNATAEVPTSYTATVNGTAVTGSIFSDSQVTTPAYDMTAGTLNFTVASPVGGTMPGTANVTIPINLMYSNVSMGWTVWIDGNETTPTVVNDTANSYLSFDIPAGTHSIAIPMSLVPEFPVTSLFLLVTGMTLVGAAVMTRFRKKQTIR